MKQTTVVLCRNKIRSRDEDIQKFSSTLTLDEIMKLIEIAEKRKAEGRSISQKQLETPEQIISDIKMHRFERSEPWPEKSNVMPADSNGRSVQTRATTKRSTSVLNAQSS